MTKIVERKGDETTRQLILRSAIHHFAEHGYEGASMRQILVEQGINVAMAHYYFGSKRDLYVESMRSYTDRVVTNRTKSLEAWRASSGSVEERVLSLMVAYSFPHYMIVAKEGGFDYARLALRVLHSWDDHSRALLRDVEPVRRKFCDELAALIPDAEDSLLWRTMEYLGVLSLADSVHYPQKLVTGTERERRRESETRARFCATMMSGGLFYVRKGGPAAGSSEANQLGLDRQSASQPECDDG